MDPITININLNLPEKQTEWICSAIACLAQIIDQAARTAGTPFPPAQVNVAQVTQKADVGNGDPATKVTIPGKPKQNGTVFDSALAMDAEKPGFPPEEKPDEPAPPKHTHEDVRNLYIELTHQDKKKEATTIIRKYAAKVPELPEDKLDAVYAELLALKAPEEDNDTDT